MRAFLLVLVLLTGCASVADKQSAAVSRAVYAEQSAIRAGRFDLAKLYAAQTLRLVPPPSRAPAISPVESKGKRYVVLPPEFNGAPALTIGSGALESLAKTDKGLNSQLKRESAALEKTERAVDAVIKEKERIVEKEQERALISSHSFWGRVRFYGTIAVLVAGLGIACYFFPFLIPILSAFAREVFTVVHWLWLAALSLFKK